MDLDRETAKILSERLTDRELEAFELIPVSVRRVPPFVVEGECIAEPEDAEGREPLDGDTDRLLQLIITESVVHRLAIRIGQHPAAKGSLEGDVLIREDVAHVEEQAEPGAVAPLFRDRQQQLGLRDRLDVAAVRPAETILWTQSGLAEAAHRVGAAREVLTVR